MSQGLNRAVSGAIALSLTFALIQRSCAQNPLVPFPSAPYTAFDSKNSFDQRASAAITYNACQRELDYTNYRAEMKQGAYKDNESENLTSILIAKIAWLNSLDFSHTCNGSITKDRPRNSDGSWKHKSFEAFQNEIVGMWALRPASCETSISGPVDSTESSLKIQWNLTVDCLIKQVNEAIQAMVKQSQMGTDDLCKLGLPGDFDINVRELVRILYLGTNQHAIRGFVLEQKTVEYMYKNLLAARGKPSPDSYSVTSPLDCSEPAGDELGAPEDTADRHNFGNELMSDVGDVFKWLLDQLFKRTAWALVAPLALAAAPFLIAAGADPWEALTPHSDIVVPETENHRLMIESSRFLINADIIRRLQSENYDHVDDIQGDQQEVREWLLRRLQLIAMDDFQEYNSRSYNRYSLNAIVNLYDFAEDAQIRTASQIVLDLSEAKFAVGSNRGRRIAPYRRLEENDGSSSPQDFLYNNGRGADHEVARAMVLAGQTQLRPGGVSPIGIQDLVNAATSTYQLPEPVLKAAVERSVLSQRIRHEGIEYYHQSPAFTISAGGIHTPATSNIFGFDRETDRGVAMPTVIIPTITGLKMGDIFYFAGVGTQHHRTENLCVWKGFACGMQPKLPSWAALAGCDRGAAISESGLVTHYFFINSAVCDPGPGPHFYLAAKIVDCDEVTCAPGLQYGLMEIVEAPFASGSTDPAFDSFVSDRYSALSASVPSFGFGAYRNSVGEIIAYHISDARPVIITVNGVPPPDFTTDGDVLYSDHKGNATIRHPASGTIVTIDFTDWSNPKRFP